MARYYPKIPDGWSRTWRPKEGVYDRPDPAMSDHMQFSPDEIEFMLAMEGFKRHHDVRFPRWSEVLFVLKSLGYRKGHDMSDEKTIVTGSATVNRMTAENTHAILVEASAIMNVKSAGDVIGLFSFLVAHWSEIVLAGSTIKEAVERLVKLWKSKLSAVEADDTIGEGCE